MDETKHAPTWAHGCGLALKSHPAYDDVRRARYWYDFTSTANIAFALRTTLAGIAALFTAMWLQLDVPRWAILTVFVVSPPVRGNALRKTAARLVGTVVGCVAAVTLVAMFPQERLTYYAVFSVWLGGCAYWATLRQGYVSYAAVLAAFTSAIVAADVASKPDQVWQAAVDRGSATVLGTLFAYFASEMSAGSDDVPRDFSNRVRKLAGELLDWAIGVIEPGNSTEPKDAPFTAKLLGLNEIRTNAIAERPALGWVKPWIDGLPTALLSLQSAVLSLSDVIAQGPEKTHYARLKDALKGVGNFFRSTAPLDLPGLRRQAASVAGARDAVWAQAPALKEIFDAILYVLAGLEAILSLSPPVDLPPIYPKPTFVTHPRYATTNLVRTVVGMLAGFAIWDATAWANGDIFMVNVAVALVLFVANDDPVAGNWPNLIGNLVGGLVALAAKYLVLVHSNQSLSLAMILFPILFIGAWAETIPKLATLGLFYINGLLVLMEPKNPQQYDFVHDINVLTALAFAYAFVPAIFVAIGAPRRGGDRIVQLLMHMRQRRRRLAANSTRDERLSFETQMYDELQRLQAVTDDPGCRERGVKLLLSALKTAETYEPARASPGASGD